VAEGAPARAAAEEEEASPPHAAPVQDEVASPMHRPPQAWGEADVGGARGAPGTPLTPGGSRAAQLFRVESHLERAKLAHGQAQSQARQVRAGAGEARAAAAAEIRKRQVELSLLSAGVGAQPGGAGGAGWPPAEAQPAQEASDPPVNWMEAQHEQAMRDSKRRYTAQQAR